MSQYYLAVDIGASSGRHILGRLENGKIVTEEIYRFENYFENRNGMLCWDTERLFREILHGMRLCKTLRKIPVSIGIDTWGVDYVLLDRHGGKLSEAAAYRDRRTEGMERKVFEKISNTELYRRTGIQQLDFNTIYQLMYEKEKRPELLEDASAMLMLPDYFHYLLTGIMAAEYTNATTTQLVNADKKTWDWELIRRLGLPEKLFQTVVGPGTILGRLKKEIADKAGFSCSVCVPAAHDTASAVAAVPSEKEDILYISSGTWSLMGTVLKKADCGDESRKANFTNEGGCGGTIRYLKNIMGLWIIQCLKRELGDKYSFSQLCEMAEAERITSLVDCNDESFIAPESVMESVAAFCADTGQTVPQTPGQYARVIYRSLACCYKNTAEEIERLTGKKYSCIYIVGGGSEADYLNRLTAEMTQKTVIAGPKEATAIGNLMIQMTADGCFSDRSEAVAAEKAGIKLKIYH